MEQGNQEDLQVCRLLGPLLKIGSPLMKHGLFCTLAKLPLELIAVSATDPAIHKKMFGLGKTTLVFSNEDLNDIMNIVKSLEESG